MDSMIGQTIAERILQTRNVAARHILQDEAAMMGAQGLVSEWLETKLHQAEAQDLLKKPSGPIAERGVLIEHVEVFVKSTDPAREDCPLPSRPESDSEQIQWLSGLPRLCPVELCPVALGSR